MSVSRSGDRWVLDTEECLMTDVYERYAMSMSVPAEIETSTPAPYQLRKLAALSQLSAPVVAEADDNGFGVFTEGNFVGTVVINPDVRVEIVQDINNGRDYSKWAFVGELELEASFKSESVIGARYKESFDVPCNIKIPTSVPFIVAKAKAEVYAQLEAKLTGSAEISAESTHVLQIGMESYDGKNWKWMAPIPSPDAKVKVSGDVEGAIIR